MVTRVGIVTLSLETKTCAETLRLTLTISGAEMQSVNLEFSKSTKFTQTSSAQLATVLYQGLVVWFSIDSLSLLIHFQ